MILVLDTNVLVSGLLNPYGPPGRIVLLAASGELSLGFDARVLAEYQNVLLRPKFNFPPEHVDSLLQQIEAEGTAVAARPLAHPLPDPDEEPFLEVAIAAAAEYLVTGNARHYPRRLCGEVAVVSPAAFLEIYRELKTERG